MKKQILYMVCATALLSSCHIYKSYDRPEDITTSGLYRDPIAENDTLVSDTTNFGNLPWREVFTDPQLQSLIEAGLKQNTDLLTAAQNVKAAEASLLSARLAYAPSLGLSPQGTISSFDKNAATKTLFIARHCQLASRLIRAVAELQTECSGHFKADESLPSGCTNASYLQHCQYVLYTNDVGPSVGNNQVYSRNPEKRMPKQWKR